MSSSNSPTVAVRIHDVWFREHDGVLFASNSAEAADADWGEVATIPVEDVVDIEKAFPGAMARYRLATLDGSIPPKQIFLVLHSACIAPDVEETNDYNRGRRPSKFSHFYVAVVKAASDS